MSRGRPKTASPPGRSTRSTRASRRSTAWSGPTSTATASNEIITGKRWRAHGDGDPGAAEPQCLFRFIWDTAAKSVHEAHASASTTASASGMQIRMVDLDGDKKLDIAVAGKTGTYVLFNRPAAGK